MAVLGGAWADGAIHLSRSGVVVVPRGRRSVDVAAGVRSTTTVIATMQSHRDGIGVEAAVPHPGAGRFTLWLTKAPPAAVTVAWLLLD